MAHTFTNLLAHIVFSTRNRKPLLNDFIRSDVHAYLGGILRELRATALAIGGTADHVHLLVRFPTDRTVADALCILKANSSRWVKERWPELQLFAWQSGYGAFSVSESNRGAVMRYIANQERHHRKSSFQDEFLALLRKHGAEFDERYIWR